MKIARQLLALLLASSSLLHAADSSATLPVSALDGVTDQTELLQRTLDALPDGGVLTLPPGTLILSRPILVRAKSLTFRGAGAFATRLRWVAKGGLYFSDTRTSGDTKGKLASWEVSDLQFEAAIANAGTALALAPQSERLTPSINVHNCDFEPVAAGQYWNTCIDVHGAHLGQISGCFFCGNTDSRATTADPQATTTYQIKISGNSTTFFIQNCHGQKSIYGILVTDHTEGANISKCYFVNCAYGYVFHTEDGGRPMFYVSQSHAAASVHPLWIYNARSSWVEGNLLVLRGYGSKVLRAAAGGASMIKIDGDLVKAIHVAGNSLEMNDQEMKEPIVGIDVTGGRDLLVTGNTIADNFPATGETGIRFGDKTGSSLIADNIISLKDPAKGVAISVSPKAKNVVVRNPFVKSNE